MKKHVTIVLFLILFISACTTKEPSAEEVAQKLTILLNDDNYKEIYQMMVPNYKAQVPEEKFVTAMGDTQSDLTYIYEKIIVVEDSANAIIKFGLSITDKDLPIKLQKTEEGWKVDAFGGVIMASCRVQGYSCKSSCVGESIEVTGAQCASSQVCCKPIKIIECQKDQDCKNRTNCNLETNKCVPIYTYIEITPLNVFLQFCQKINNYDHSLRKQVSVDEDLCKKAYQIIYNNGELTGEMPSEVSSNCSGKTGGTLNFLPSGSYDYFNELHICKTGYLVYVEPDTKEKVDIKALK